MGGVPSRDSWFKNDAFKGMLAAEVDHSAAVPTSTDPETAAGSEAMRAPYETWERIRRDFLEVGFNLADTASHTAGLHVIQQVDTLQKRISDAPREAAWGDALAALTELEELCGRERVAHFIMRANLPMLRPWIEQWRDLLIGTELWSKAAYGGRVEQARRQLDRLEKLARVRAAAPLRDGFRSADAMLGFLHWAQSVLEMHFASKALPQVRDAADGEDEAAVGRLDDLLSRDEAFLAQCRDYAGPPAVEQLLNVAAQARRKHLLRLAVAKDDTVAAESLGAPLKPRPVPRASFGWRLVGKFIVNFLAAFAEVEVFERVLGYFGWAPDPPPVSQATPGWSLVGKFALVLLVLANQAVRQGAR